MFKFLEILNFHNPLLSMHY